MQVSDEESEYHTANQSPAGYHFNRSIERNSKAFQKFKTCVKPKKIQQVNLELADSDEGQELPNIFENDESKISEVPAPNLKDGKFLKSPSSGKTPISRSEPRVFEGSKIFIESVQ